MDQPQLPKIDRKKLKKLRKRVAQVQTEGERSGLLTSLEWLEYQRLETTATYEQSIGPSVHVRKSKEGIKVEGTHHRDLLAWFLQQGIDPISNSASNEQPKKCKKRSRSDTNDPLQNPSIPSWASIHNPGTLQNIVVLEVHVPDDISSYSSILESHFEASSKSHAALQTKWFQGPMPRSISDSLLYFVKNRVKKPKPEIKPSSSKDHILEQLQDLTVPSEDWAKERYPKVCQDSVVGDPKKEDDETSQSVTIKEPDSIPLEDAKALVDKIGFRVENQNEDDKQLYICTQPRTNSNDTHARVFGMDCEMVRTSLGAELARVTLVQFEDFQEDSLKTKTVLDVLVKPDNPVQDYLTRHSGVTAKLLEPVSTRLTQVQATLANFLRPNDILVGHSLENDLLATHFIHPNVIDTALVFRPRHKRTKFSLRHLAAALLRKTIQSGSHCSEEDAVTALELAVRRAWLGDSFGLAGGDERKSLFEGLHSEATVVCIGPTPWLQCHVTNHANGIHALGYDSIPDCKKAMLAWVKGRRKAHLTWSHLNINSENEDNDLESLKGLLVSSSTFV
jgi:DNA polymerase III epsilon subunit-like protein